MSNPTTYERGFSFTDAQADAPETPLSGSRVDAELDNVATSIGELIEALADIRASDGGLQAGVVDTAALGSGVSLGVDSPTEWVTATAYTASTSLVWESNKLYRCLTTHTSGTFATDLAASKWVEVADFTPAGVVAAEDVTFDDTDMDVATPAPDAQEAIALLDAAVAALQAAGGISLAQLAAAVTMRHVPVGTILDYGGTSAPSGYLLCDGSLVSRTTYSALYAVVGESFGAGDGVNTFALPDLRGRVTAGQDDMGGTSANRLTNASGGVDGDVLGATGGAETHALVANENGSHTHTATTDAGGDHGHPWRQSTGVGAASDATGGFMLDNASDATKSAFTGTVSDVDGEQIGASGTHTHTLTTASSGAGDAHNNVQPVCIVNKIIFVGV